MSQLDRRLLEAYAHCRKIALGHYENFPVGSALIPRQLRPHFFAIYAFMRTADDFADLPHRMSAERLELLANWRKNLHESFEGHVPADLTFLALQHTARKFKLDPQPFELLLDAFEFDARGEVQFETFNDLHWYTQRSAEPVGQLVLALFGYKDAERIGWSNNICTALQLLNFIQDAKEDLEQGRCYFPREDYSQFGIQSPAEIASSPNAGQLMRLECDRVERLLEIGAPLSESIQGRLKYELRAVLLGARGMLTKIRAADGDTIHVRPQLSGSERRGILFKALLTSPKGH
jgi:squalene synthase HpnC